MSTYDKASLVLIPSGTKEGVVFSQKPTNGDGDFTFSRSTAATRVNADGLIEKETQNLLLQSNSFDTTWTNPSSSVTGGQSGYDGTSSAWLVTLDSGSGSVRQDVSASGVQTFSVYAKAGNIDWVALSPDSVDRPLVYFDLGNGVVGTNVDGNAIKGSIEDAGSGWYRCSIIYSRSITQVRIFPADSDNVLGSTGDTIYIQDAQLNQGLVADSYLETTTTAVYGGITDNIPRLDYTDASCPSLLLEPQRTNTITGSEYFDGGSLVNGGITVEYNTADTLSPEGLYNAAKLTAAGTFPRYYDYPTIGDNVNVTLSSFAKAGSASVFTIRAINKNSESAVVNFDLSAGTAELSQEDELTPTFDIVDMGNGWYRCSISTNTGSGASAFQIRPISHAQGETGGWSGTNYIYAYGAQMEQDASYPTSYIPTYGASVTKLEDECSVTGVSDLIGQTEGTLYFEGFAIASESTNKRISLSDGTNANRVTLSFNLNAISFIVISNNVASISTTITSSPDTNHKIAFAYKENDFVAYIDGTQVVTDSSGATFSGALNSFRFSDGQSGLSPFAGDIKQALLFKTRLSNEELADLTTI